MKKPVLICLWLIIVLPAYGQNERKVIRDGVRAYEGGQFSEAEVEFRKAGSINQESYEAEFNTGAALYGQEKYEETVKQYETLLSRTDDAGKEARCLSPQQGPGGTRQRGHTERVPKPGCFI